MTGAGADHRHSRSLAVDPSLGDYRWPTRYGDFTASRTPLSGNKAGWAHLELTTLCLRSVGQLWYLRWSLAGALRYHVLPVDRAVNQRCRWRLS